MATKPTIVRNPASKKQGEMASAAADIQKALTIKPPLDLEMGEDKLAKELKGLLPNIQEGDDLAVTTWATLKKLGWKSGKAAKAEKAPKAATHKSPKAEKPADVRKITLLVKENPKRAGSESAKRFSCYKTGMTVEKALEAGVTAGDIAWDIKHKFISVK